MTKIFSLSKNQQQKLNHVLYQHLHFHIKIDSFSATYDATEFDVSKIIISFLATNLGNVASASAKRAEMHNKYLMPSEYNTKKN